jgi:hypothetical protein
MPIIIYMSMIGTTNGIPENNFSLGKLSGEAAVWILGYTSVFVCVYVCVCSVFHARHCVYEKKSDIIAKSMKFVKV